MQDLMKAMVLETPRTRLILKDVAIPKPQPNQVLVKVHACAICRTDLHVIDGDLKHPKLPLILGHEIIGTIIETGAKVSLRSNGEKVGIPWLASTCGKCKYCLSDQENLCDNAQFTGYTMDGGFAEFTVADERYCFPITQSDHAHAAPLLCAGLIGYRSFKFCGQHCEHLGIYGFGAAAHIITQYAINKGIKVYAFTRTGDSDGQQFALKLGAHWAGSSEQKPPQKLDSCIIFAPVGSLVKIALESTRKGGIVVCGGIHMTDIPSFSYNLLWGERCIKSVANLTRADGIEFMSEISKAKIKTEITAFKLNAANEAIDQLRSGKLNGAAVLII